MQKLNKNQTLKLKKLIGQHMHEIIENKKKATDTFNKIKKYGVKNMPEAIVLYKANRKTLQG